MFLSTTDHISPQCIIMQKTGKEIGNVPDFNILSNTMVKQVLSVDSVDIHIYSHNTTNKNYTCC